MRLLPLLVSATGLAGLVAVLAVTASGFRTIDAGPDPGREIRESVSRPEIPPPPAPPVPSVAAIDTRSGPDQAMPPSPDGAGSPAAPPRAVAPTVVAVPPVDPATLERVEARPPLSAIAAAPPPRKPPPKPLLFQPVAEAAGIVAAGGRTIAIADIEPVADAQTCVRDGGGEWPCGRAARTAFRAFIRGRAVTCDFPEGEVPDTLSTTCRVGARDMGAWLVENGWARAKGDAYGAEAKAAVDARRGMFGPGPAQLPGEAARPDDGGSGPALAPAAGPPDTTATSDISILPPGTAVVPDATARETPPEEELRGAIAGEPPPVSPLPPPLSPAQ